MFAKYTVLAAALLLACGAADAQVGVTADLGTTGVGFHVVVPMESDLNGRFGANYFKHDFDKSSGGVGYDMDGKLQTIEALFDWYVLDGSPFRLTAGVLYNGNSIGAHAKPNADGGYILNGHSYTAADVGTLSGRIDYTKASPYLGIGWGNALKQTRGWSLGGDLGVYYQNNPNVQLASIGCTTSSTVCQAIVTDVETQRQKLRDDIDNLKFYPVLRLNIGYSF